MEEEAYEASEEEEEEDEGSLEVSASPDAVLVNLAVCYRASARPKD